MKFRCSILFLAFLFCGAVVAAQPVSKYFPFKVDDEFNISIKPSDPAVVKKFSRVFADNGRSVANGDDWDGAIQQILGRYDTDLLLSGEIDFNSSAEVFTVNVGSAENIPRFMKAVRPTLNDPKKLDAFLKDLDRLLKKKK